MVLLTWQSTLAGFDDVVSRPTYQPTPPLLHAPRRRPHARGAAVPTVDAPCPGTRHCTAAASHAHTLLMSSSLALVVVFCLRTRCSCPIPLGSGRPQSRQQASAATTIGRDGAAGAWLLPDSHYHSCRLRVLSPNRILHVAYTRTRTYDVRRMALVHWPAAVVTSDYDAVSP